MISTKLACDLDVDAKMLYFGPDGAKVTRYIPDAVTMSAASMHDTENIKHVAAIFRKIHTCGVDTGVPFEVFDMAQGYERIIREKCVAMFDDYAEVKAAVIAVKAEIDA